MDVCFPKYIRPKTWVCSNDLDVQLCSRGGPHATPAPIAPAPAVEEPVVEPVEEPVEEPVVEPTPEPVEEPTPEPVEEPVEEPTPEPVEEPVEEPTPEPEPIVEPEVIPEPTPVEEDLGPIAVVTNFDTAKKGDAAVLTEGDTIVSTSADVTRTGSLSTVPFLAGEYSFVDFEIISSVNNDADNFNLGACLEDVDRNDG